MSLTHGRYKSGRAREGTSDEVIPQQKITNAMANGRQATILFENHGDQTQVTITFDAESQNPVELQQQGWQAILDTFKNYVETN